MNAKKANEKDWLTGSDPSQMLMAIKDRSSDRKRRLFAVASCRTVTEMIPADQCWRVIDAAERFADNPLAHDELQAARAQLLDWIELIYRQEFEEVAWRRMVSEIGAIPVIVPQLSGTAWILRDIFGNPFRQMAFDPKWRTEAAVGLALKMYDDRDFRAMPILADALEEAGCDVAERLAHCREPGVHVRGCWVVDLVLGKG